MGAAKVCQLTLGPTGCVAQWQMPKAECLQRELRKIGMEFPGNMYALVEWGEEGNKN